MAELAGQISINAAGLSVFLIAAAIFLFALACAGVALTRMLQLYIATNVTISRELAAIQKSIVFPQPSPSVPVQSSEPDPKGKTQPHPSSFTEGEILGYDEAEMADQEAIRILRAQRKSEGGMTDAEWQSEIDKVNAAGFQEEPV